MGWNHQPVMYVSKNVVIHTITSSFSRRALWKKNIKPIETHDCITIFFGMNSQDLYSSWKNGGLFHLSKQIHMYHMFLLITLLHCKPPIYIYFPRPGLSDPKLSMETLGPVGQPFRRFQGQTFGFLRSWSSTLPCWSMVDKCYVKVRFF